MGRHEHLKWCKQRALAYVDRGDTLGAVTSMASDLLKHPAWDRQFVAFMVLSANIDVQAGDRQAVRRWIEGFN
jgi:hypothetical protein